MHGETPVYMAVVASSHLKSQVWHTELGDENELAWQAYVVKAFAGKPDNLNPVSR